MPYPKIISPKVKTPGCFDKFRYHFPLTWDKITS